MADNARLTQATPQEIIISMLAGLFAPLIAIFLIIQLIAGIQGKQVDKDSPAVAAKIVENNIRPFAKLEALDANAPKVEKSGQEVYDSVCGACHGSGALGAPKYQNKGDWGPRIGKGLDALSKHALEGFNQMPARGGNPDLSDTEVTRAIVYMANAAGAKFKEPAAPTPPPSASVAVSATAAAPEAPDAAELAKGKNVFEGTCKACHETGVAGAPKFGDKAAWAPRIKTGFEALYTSAVKGKNAMPAKGGNASLTYADVKAAVDYMVSKAK
ncbi:MAG TPA: c-type cytochrome [Thiobacillaceae bacterium]|nr:c-type cytochrome [Thiobacillaceae bacterium]